MAVRRIALDAEAGEISAELERRGITAKTRVRVLVEIAQDDELPMTAMAQSGAAFEWLSQEPDLYTDRDIIHQGN